jgi:apolipoprotein D and lipocalin family protein
MKIALTCIRNSTALVGAALLLAGCAAQRSPDLPPLEVVPRVDLARYMGTWHEIASFPTWFQKGCIASTATYALRDDGRVGVLNQCYKGSIDHPDSASGTAWVVDPATNAKLKVQFFWPFSGDYWIIDLDPGYEYAVVGHPSREYLWILSRSPQMDEARFERILDRLKQQHYDTSRLARTRQFF